MHGSDAPLGGDLKTDTVTIIGATLDLQDKTVREAMTPIDKAVMLHIDAKLDYDTLRRICATGHSRIPVYEEVEVDVPAAMVECANVGEHGQMVNNERMVKHKVKKIIGILLVKQCVLLDHEGMPSASIVVFFGANLKFQMPFRSARCASSRSRLSLRMNPSSGSLTVSKKVVATWLLSPVSASNVHRVSKKPSNVGSRNVFWERFMAIRPHLILQALSLSPTARMRAKA